MQVVIDAEAISAAVGAICGAAGAGLALAIRVARPVRRHIERFRLFAEDWEGEPARYDGAVPERPGMMKRMAALERAQIQHEDVHRAEIVASMNGGRPA